MFIVNSVLSINTHTQPDPYKTAQFAGQTYTGQNASRIPFSEYLESLIGQADAVTASKQLQCQETGVLMGYYLPLQMTVRPEMKLTIGNRQSNPDV